jgi:DNA-binding LacI/PurR family transcriptional regulator
MELTVRERIRALGTGGVTCLAEMAGVRPSVVSKIQRNPVLISEPQAAAVMAALEDLEFLMAQVAEAQSSGVPFSVNLRDIPIVKRQIELLRTAEAGLADAKLEAQTKETMAVLDNLLRDKA